MNLSPHFTLDELAKSQYALRNGIDNTPDQLTINRLILLCNQTLERVRAYICNGKPIFINSGYRCPKLNAAIGGATHSQHMLGEAADIELPGFSHHEAIQLIRHNENIPFDQLIWEGGDQGWVHISYSANRQRREVLTALFIDGVAEYKPFV